MSRSRSLTVEFQKHVGLQTMVHDLVAALRRTRHIQYLTINLMAYEPEEIRPTVLHYMEFSLPVVRSLQLMYNASHGAVPDPMPHACGPATHRGYTMLHASMISVEWCDFLESISTFPSVSMRLTEPVVLSPESICLLGCFLLFFMYGAAVESDVDAFSHSNSVGAPNHRCTAI